MCQYLQSQNVAKDVVMTPWRLAPQGLGPRMPGSASTCMRPVSTGLNVCCRFHNVLVKTVVGDVRIALGHSPLDVVDHQVGMDERLHPIRALLAEHQVVGLYGMGGIGKSTVARALYNQLVAGFAGRCCLLELGRKADNAHVQQLQAKALWELCQIKEQVSNIHQVSYP